MDPLDDITEQQFKDGRDHRFGTTKPEKLDIPFQNAMIEGGQWAYTVRKKFLSEGDDTEEGDEDAGLTATKVLKKHYGKPIFCNSRVGQASVKSPDGRQVLIGGEHEVSSQTPCRENHTDNP
jgi:hypothetical protein